MRVFRVAMPAVGLLFLGYLIGRLGPEEIWRHLGALGWAFAVVLLVAFSWHVTNTVAWGFAFLPGAFRPRLRTLFAAKLAGEAVNQLTPLANLGGEPLKAYLLRRESPASRGLASVVVNKAAQVLVGLFFSAVGLSLVLLYWRLPLTVPLSVQAGLAALLGLGALLTGILWRKRLRLFSSLLVALSHLGVRMDLLERGLSHAVRTDRQIGRFYQEHRGRFVLVLLCHGAGWLLGAVETWVILLALGAHVDFEIAFLITSLTTIINGLFFFMPSNIGVLEGGQVFLVATLGLDPAMGLSMGIAKRMRKVFYISVGWLLLTQLSRGALEAGLARARRAAAQASPPLAQSKATYR
ncbi:MAG: flippase-like domain-containing protein [Candidatus Latescibacterota bacterium]